MKKKSTVHPKDIIEQTIVENVKHDTAKLSIDGAQEGTVAPYATPMTPYDQLMEDKADSKIEYSQSKQKEHSLIQAYKSYSINTKN